MNICHNCCYHCLHKNTKNHCWNCFVSEHLQTTVFKDNDIYFFQCTEEIRKNIIEHPGYILGYNYQNKIYKLFDVKDLVYTHFYLIKHIVSEYLIRKNNNKLSKQVDEMTLSNTQILDKVFKDKYILDTSTSKVIKI